MAERRPPRVRRWPTVRAVATLVVLACGAANAAELTVEVGDIAGRPTADAVVLLHRVGTAPEPEAPRVKIVDQRDETFVPYVETFRPGDRVVFSNSDATRHHVYSFSPQRRFEFVLAPGERSEPLLLENAGVIAVGCNIHDRMLAYLHVAEAPWQARTDATGQARIEALTPGEYRLGVWHPQLKGAPPASRAVVLDSPQARQHSSFALPLRPDPRASHDPERGDY